MRASTTALSRHYPILVQSSQHCAGTTFTGLSFDRIIERLQANARRIRDKKENPKATKKRQERACLPALGDIRQVKGVVGWDSEPPAVRRPAGAGGGWNLKASRSS
jgi:hypothetical protein